MSRVTILDLVSDYKDADIDMSTCKKSRDIQVIPRKMVEMIIEKCVRDESEPAYSNATQEEATDIRKYAESLLKQFEEDENDK